jgi:hypothetical protein
MYSFGKSIKYNIDAFRGFSYSPQTPIKVNVLHFYLINPNTLIILIMGGGGSHKFISQYQSLRTPE